MPALLVLRRHARRECCENVTRSIFDFNKLKRKKPETSKNKNPNMKKIIALVLFSVLAAIGARADIVFYEPFNYSNGPVCVTSTNGTGSITISNWITHSGNLDATNNNRRLENQQSSRSGDIHRFFPAAYTNAPTQLFASFILNCTNLPNAAGTYFAHFYTNSSIFQGRLMALAGTNICQPGTFRLGVSGAQSNPSGISSVDLALNQDYQVVFAWDPATTAQAQLWVNPVTSADVSVKSHDGISGVIAPSQAFAFRQAGSSGNCFLTISNLTVATTFEEAVATTLATNAVAPIIINQPVGTTNFVGGTVSVASLVNGQGLSSMTYQWYQGVNPYSNPAGNTNVLIIANAQTTDSGDFRLVATTPYGLSVTSSVAKVLISLVKAPPSFVTQPVSQTLYRGQDLVLSTTVTSPGNVTYTWYSNNVIVTAGQSDAGTISTLTLPNAQTSFSATYKVAVTNDYTGIPTNGVISTNAVVTVLNPQHVTIAYLRTLVDSAYQPTNSTTPFEISGVVTAYTNLTSANTSGYFLQDATAGINIFATFASTFRPLQGDTVTFVGIMSYFSSTGLELLADTTTRTYTSYAITGTGVLPAARIIPFTVTNLFGYDYVNTNLAGSLVTLTNVYFGTNAGVVLPPSSNYAGTVTNAAGAPFRIQFFGTDLDTASQTLPAFAKSVTGIFYGGHPNFSIGVTKFSDIVTNPPVILPVPLTATLSGGNFTFNWTDPSFTLQTTTNILGPWIDITGATDGFMTNITTDPANFFRLFHP